MRLSFLLSILFSTISVTALGINCGGSFFCTPGGTGGTLTGVIQLVGNISATDEFSPGEHIACQSHLCAFTQNYNQTITADETLYFLNLLE